MVRAPVFSFYCEKNPGACDTAGANTPNDEVIAYTVRMFRDHGKAKKYYHDGRIQMPPGRASTREFCTSS